MKVDETINITNLLTVGMQAKSSSSNDTGNFADILSSTSEKKDVTVNQQKTVNTIPDNKDANTSTAVTEKTVKQNNAENVKDTASPSTDNKDTVESDEDLCSEDMEDVMEAVSALLTQLSQILQCTPDELKEKLQDFGMDFKDIFNLDEMKNFFLSENQADAMDLLTNEDLNGQFKQLIDVITQATDELSDFVVDLEGISFDDIQSKTHELFNAGQTDIKDTLVLTNEQPDANLLTDVSDVSNEPYIQVTDNRKETVTKQSTDNKESFSQTGSEEKATQFNGLQRSETSTETQDFVKNPILQGIQDAMNGLDDVSMVEDASPVDARQVVEQIVEQIKVQMNQDSTSLQMQLYPEHLGRIQIHVVSKEGIMTAQIIAENEAAKQAIEGGLASLKESMEQQNIKVEAIEVMVSTTGFERNDEHNDAQQKTPSSKARRRINLGDLGDEDVLTEEDMAETEKMKATGSSVSYSV